MSRQAKKQPSVHTADPLTDSDVCQKLALFRQILASCFGPTGKLKHIHNHVGGRVLTTSTSAVLLKAVSVSHPLLKLLAAGILDHTSRFSDCGLFVGILSLALIDNAQRLTAEPAVVAKVYRGLLGLCTSYLAREDCVCRVRVDLGSAQSLLTLARCAVASKPACMLTPGEVEHVSSLVVQSFLLTVPCYAAGEARLGRTVTLTAEGRAVLDSAVFPGLLLELPEEPLPGEVEGRGPGSGRLALFSASLAGDLQEVGDGPLEMDGEFCHEEAILEQLLELGVQVVRDGVDLFACQKVVHPVLQQYLRKHGVMVVERLGLALMEPLALMTGAQPLANVQAPFPTECYGQVQGFAVRRCGSRAMLHLLPTGDTTVCTLALCHRNETVLDELKETCQRAEHVLRLTLKDPFALLGGGCTETHLAAYIRNKSSVDVATAAFSLGCSQTHYLLAAEGFCHALESVARALEHDGGECLVDLSHGHRWAVSASAASTKAPWSDLVGACGCGLLRSRPDLEWVPLRATQRHSSPAPPADTISQPQILDSFSAKLNALQVAVEMANLILDLKYIIQDRN